MSFWAYMLHCRGGYFYVGHTDSLEQRITQHQTGVVAGFAADHRPVELVWSQEFATREEAKAAEHRLKGWSRAKKMALIRGDWDKISSLAKGKGSPSTSSGLADVMDSGLPVPVRPELVEGLSLSCHPDTPCAAVEHIFVDVRREGVALALTYRVFGDLDRVRLPEPISPVRADNLWQKTCFEAFVKPVGSERYLEFNFDPARRWAIYGFDGYRKGQSEPNLPAPRIGVPVYGSSFIMSPTAYLEGIGAFDLALSAVIEEKDGTKSYWALAHPPGAPDFHHPDCFQLTLPAPDAA